MKKLMKCVVCGQYTLSDIHCNRRTVSPHPIASGVEKNIKERIKMRLQNLEKKELEEFNNQIYS